MNLLIFFAVQHFWKSRFRSFVFISTISLMMIFGLMVLVIFPESVQAQSVGSEEIIRFHSNLELFENGDVLVTESIRVRAMGREIRRGIYRTIPTYYRDRYRNRIKMDFEVIGLLKDGIKEPFFIEKKSGNIIINFGDDTFLSPGVYTYTLSYKLNRVIGFFDDFDELYWNVTGNEWSFFIKEASADVKLPNGFEVLHVACYTGVIGATETRCTSYIRSDGSVHFMAMDALSPGQGLTIAAAWPKGLTPESTAGENLRALFFDNKGALTGLLGIFFVFIYYCYAWDKVGRDPEKGLIIPLYKAPEGLSPAAVRFVMKMGFDDKSFSAALVSLAIKGCLVIKEEKRKFTLQKVAGNNSELSRGEQEVFDKLFSKNDVMVINQTNNKTIQLARKALETTLKNDFEKTHFNINGKYLIPGTVVSLLTVAGIFLFSEIDESLFFFSVWITIWTLGSTAFAINIFGLWKNALANKAAIGTAIFRSLMAVPFFLAEIYVFTIIGLEIGFLSVVLILVILVMNILFYEWMKALTLFGRQMMDKIEGFKMYLSVAEGSRIILMGAPEKNMGLYEKYLPYAIAMDVENAWTRQFNNVIEQISFKSGYQPEWYQSKRPFNITNINRMMGSLGSALSSAVSSSSGSRGGGFSGGGRGGGGGGGR
jgi:uncharacterized membrane protein YgcG